MEKIIILMKQKLIIVKEIKRVTEIENFKFEKNKQHEKVISDFTFFIEKRQAMLEKAKQLDNLISIEKKNVKNVKESSKNIYEYQIIKEKINKIVEETIKMDNENNIVINNIYEEVKKRIKLIKVGKTIISAYESGFVTLQF